MPQLTYPPKELMVNLEQEFIKKWVKVEKKKILNKLLCRWYVYIYIYMLKWKFDEVLEYLQCLLKDAMMKSYPFGEMVS